MTTKTPAWTMGDRLRKARESAGLGVSEMAEQLLTSRSTVNNYESDRTRPTAVKLRRIAEVTGVPMTWLLGGAEVVDDLGEEGSTGVRTLSNHHARLLTAA